MRKGKGLNEMMIYKQWIDEACHICGSKPLEIWALTYVEMGIEKSEPVLVCPSQFKPFGCGTFFDPSQYDIDEKDLRAES